MNRQSAVCPSVRNKARLWFLQSQTLQANRAGTPLLSTADRSVARNALTAQGGGSGHVAPPTWLRQCGDRVTGNCRRFLAVGGEQRTASDSRRATAPIKRSARGRGMSLATEQRAMTARACKHSTGESAAKIAARLRATCRQVFDFSSDIRAVSVRQSKMRSCVVHHATRPASAE
jgi:hypothetical protein